ncbi:murein biosynthesis integral membrane protein MurJ [Chelatococcus sp. SYSU_G07232]|uniref:Probable lipid II flippase MurJ n=1 Tax=Chelatococcus albus TaxID=3047466 RepID=A0ABT7AIV5_9HYPH|nr:murein biosynthesis integral membrane protein MurJ [Chelatococcus sp. SYSU_G07232]MDJ1158739.1 murein biosynthesis integral membrane protein MurJ [Chelatococcus sp. SYSU_G07232]
MSLARAGLVVGVSTVLSRLLGFARDMLIARVLGAGPVADAFLIAFRVPNLARRVLAEGGLNAGIVPLQAHIATEQGAAAAHRFAAESLTASALLLLAVTAVAELAAPWIVTMLASGYDSPGKLALAAHYLRLAFPFVTAAGLASVVSAFLNAQRRFAAAAVAPALVNVLLVGALVVLDGASGMTAEELGAALAIAVTVSGLVHLVAVALAAAALPQPLRLVWPRRSANLRRLARLVLPALAASGVAQFAILVGTQVASYRPGAVSWLYYADRVFQLPLSFVGVAVGIVLLPEIAARLGRGDEAGAGEAQTRALEAALALALPAAVALTVLAWPIAQGLFQHGAFTAGDTAGTAAALAGLAPGLPAAVAGKVLAQPFFARERLRLPLAAGFAGLAVTGLAGGVLNRWYGVAGIALGVSLGLWAHAGLLAFGLWRGRLWQADRGFSARLPRFALACAVMGLAVNGLADLLGPWLEPARALPLKLTALAGLSLVGAVVYGLAACLFGALAWPNVKALLRRA